MFVYVDESGDSGVKGKKDSSEFFIVTAIIFQNREDAEECSNIIDQLRKELNWNANHEFKFNKLSAQYRRRFLRAVAESKFTYCTVVIDKKLLSGPGFQYKNSFYKYPIRMLFQNSKEYLDEAIVTIDKTGEREFRKEIESYLKRHTNTSSDSVCIKKVRMQDSHRDNLLQLADMVCGAVGRSLKTNKTDYRIYRALVAHREIHFQRWPTGIKK